MWAEFFFAFESPTKATLVAQMVHWVPAEVQEQEVVVAEQQLVAVEYQLAEMVAAGVAARCWRS